jgi:2-oxoacid:acceptor oxidoreductase delta subunit (pyruvate/2-ketoisovalerate family)
MTLNTYFKHEGPWSDANDPLMVLDTGDWRFERPVVDKDKCILCGICSIYCPVQIIEMVPESHFEAEMAFCKGCGICAQECPMQAISMVPEGEFQK